MQALQGIFGPDSEELIESGDPVADKERRAQFVKLYEEKNSLTQSGQGMEISIGNEEWPFPIPVVQKDGQWYFDTEAGLDEILARRIGKNELSAIQFCLAYVDAQREYASKDRDGDGLLTYALKFRSDKGKHNGLYWQAKEGEELSPLGELAATAQKQGYSAERTNLHPILGYYYRILTSQGANAQGGAYDYLVRGKCWAGLPWWPIRPTTVHRGHDLYREPRGTGVPERPGREDGGGGSGHDAFRSGQFVAEGGIGGAEAKGCLT